MDDEAWNELNAEYERIIENLSSQSNRPSLNCIVELFETSPFIRMAFDAEGQTLEKDSRVALLLVALRKDELEEHPSKRPAFSDGNLNGLVWEHNNTRRSLNLDLCNRYIALADDSRDHYDALARLCVECVSSKGLFQPYLFYNLRALFEEGRLQSTSPTMPDCVSLWLNGVLTGQVKPPRKEKPKKLFHRNLYISIALSEFRDLVGNEFGLTLTKNRNSGFASLTMHALRKALENLKSKEAIPNSVGLPSEMHLEKIFYDSGPLFRGKE